MPTSTDNGEATLNDTGVENAVDAFLATLEDKSDADNEQPSEEETRKKKPQSEEQPAEAEEAEETSDESPEETEEEGEEQEEQKDDKTKKAYVEDDEAVVKVKVGDQEIEAPVKDLKRLYGQEAALTRRSQEVANERKAVEDRGRAYAAKLDKLVSDATARADEFRKLNFFALAKDPNITAEQLAVLQDEARKAFEQETFLKNEANEIVQGAQKEAQTKLLERARECVTTLKDQASPYYIEGWGQKAYDELRNFAVQNGLSRETVNELVDAPALKLLHMAMLYSKVSGPNGRVKVTTKPNSKTPKKIVKSSGTAAPSPSAKSESKQRDAMKKLEQHGSVDNAANAFLAGWADAEE